MVPLSERRRRTQQQQRVVQMSNTSGISRAERVVRRRQADGSFKEYRYPAYAPPSGPTEPPPGDTLGDLIDRYQRSSLWRGMKESTHRNKICCFRYLAKLTREPLAKITRRILLDNVEAVAEAHGDGAGLNFAKHVMALFSFAQDKEWIDLNPAQRIAGDLEFGEFPAWSEAEYQQAIGWTALPERLRRALVLARWTAQRRADLIKMDWYHLWTDPKGAGWITVKQEKKSTKKKAAPEMQVPVARELAAELKAWRAELKVVDRQGNPTGPILLTDAGLPWRGGNLSVQLSNHLEKIPGFNPRLNIHGLRKFALTDLAERGAPVHVLKAFGGHETLQMVQHYTKGADQMRGAHMVRQLLDN
jgi:integrase